MKVLPMTFHQVLQVGFSRGIVNTTGPILKHFETQLEVE